MKTKLIEIRDRGTCIPALAIQMYSDNPVVQYYLHRAGYPANGESVMLMIIADGKATNDPYEWVGLNMGPRTMPHAHHFILDHFDELKDGDVVDVQVILGEASVPKISERLTRASGG